MKPDPKQPKPRLRECLPYLEARTEDAGFTGRLYLDFLHGTFMQAGGWKLEQVKPEDMIQCPK